MPSNTDAHRERFSLVVGGPFHRTLRRLRLTGDDDLPTRRAAVILALLAWLPPALLAVADSILNDYPAWDFFSDWTVYTRYLVAIWFMVATERYADDRIALLIEHFTQARLLSDDVLPRFTQALTIADRRSSSGLAEGLILVASLAWSLTVAGYVITQEGTSWEGTIVGGDVSLSWAGGAASLLSNPLFIFLVLRWIWRFVVWTNLLFRISRMPLQLTPLHPDRSAGLGFLSIYPSIFSGFVFALSCVIASSILKELRIEQHPAETIWLALGVWLAIVMVMFIGPLFVFAGPLYATRERALMEYGRLASQHHLAFHQRWISESRSGAELLGSTEPSSASDLNASVQAVRELQLVPIDRAAVLHLAVSAGIPLLAVVTAQIPIGQLLRWIVGAII